MRKIGLLLFFFLVCNLAFSQLVYSTLNGRIDFTSLKGMNLLEAFSDKLYVKFKPKTKDIIFKVQISSFSFSNCSKIVEKTFNDVYLESNVYHWAKFEGKIVNDSLNLEELGNEEVTVEGKFTVHGVEKNRRIKGLLIKKENNILTFNAKFPVILSDHNITVLNADIDRLANEIEVKVYAEAELLK